MVFLRECKGLIPCRVVKRINRFVVMVKRQGNGYNEESFAHLTNTGRLLELIYPGATVYCIPKNNPKTSLGVIGAGIRGRKNDDSNKAVLIDTKEQTRSFEAAVKLNAIPWMRNWHISRSEVPVNNVKIDYEIRRGRGVGYLETKSAALVANDGYSMYPDCPSSRGRKHIGELQKLLWSGKRCIICFVCAHPLAKSFRPNSDADWQLYLDLKSAKHNGLEVRALKVFLDLKSQMIYLENPDLPVELN